MPLYFWRDIRRLDIYRFRRQLAAINADDIWYFASGGVIGSLLSTALQPMLNSSGGTIALLCVWAAGLAAG